MDLGFVPTLINLISTERSPSHEHMLSLLVCLVEENARAVNECRSPQYNLKDFLHRYIFNIRQKEECQVSNDQLLGVEEVSLLKDYNLSMPYVAYFNCL